MNALKCWLFSHKEISYPIDSNFKRYECVRCGRFRDKCTNIELIIACDELRRLLE